MDATLDDPHRIGRIFISHTHADQKLSDALVEAIDVLFSKRVVTESSSKSGGEGSIKPGQPWFEWIKDNVKSVDLAIILLSPGSALKPWILWESGAVYGAALAGGDVKARKLRPLVYRLTSEQMPTPFRDLQTVPGEDRAKIVNFFEDLMNSFEERMTSAEIRNFGARQNEVVDTYLRSVREALHDAPMLPTEAAVQEWCDRLDDYVRDNRASEIHTVHDWLNLTFGRGKNGKSLPLDLRIHRRLGDAYLSAKLPTEAAEEFSLALELAPRDIFLLRRQGKAYLDADRADQASQVIARISELDPDAFSRNEECAALKARWHRKVADFEGAADTCAQARRKLPNSSYLCDVHGQDLLELGRLEEARMVFRRLIEIIDAKGESNLWTHASLATACLVLGDADRAQRHLREIALASPSPDNLKRIEEGLERVRKALQLDEADFECWRTLMRGLRT